MVDRDDLLLLLLQHCRKLMWEKYRNWNLIEIFFPMSMEFVHIRCQCSFGIIKSNRVIYFRVNNSKYIPILISRCRPINATVQTFSIGPIDGQCLLYSPPHHMPENKNSFYRIDCVVIEADRIKWMGMGNKFGASVKSLNTECQVQVQIAWCKRKDIACAKCEITIRTDPLQQAA